MSSTANVSVPGSQQKQPWCSVIIPTLNEARFIGRTLTRLLASPPSSFEIIIADGGSTDDTVAIARGHGAHIVRSYRGRAAQLNAGAAAARGDSLLFLHADTLLPPDFARFFPPGYHGPAACFQLRFTNQRQSALLRFYSYCTRFDFDAFRFGDQGLWVLQRDFAAVGGYPTNWQLLEDNYLVRKLRAYRGAFRVLPVAVETSPRKYLRNGVAYTQLVYTLLYTMYRTGASQQLLQKTYARLLH
ncbi:TIGR04283 family arsenosugar biosynthesis glycosyltransferase [Lewinella sp. IMCC34191]|uniref:TIGR04283 family arsenosugar biosynthesis glycosyltransferase n=1 Tax=Lewinella sp. IMCC34191 TaxID=2259172 RepID=UPI000E230B3B|nr:TIGR04283 family arsenosugar biosynthesis glycosyltransferase [Lewinella sp. IMCC34191]